MMVGTSWWICLIQLPHPIMKCLNLCFFCGRGAYFVDWYQSVIFVTWTFLTSFLTLWVSLRMHIIYRHQQEYELPCHGKKGALNNKIKLLTAQQKEKVGYLPCQRMANYSKWICLIPNSAPMPFNVGVCRTMKRTMIVSIVCLPLLSNIFIFTVII